MSRRVAFVKYQLPALVWSVAIFALSAVPGMSSVRFPIRADKLIHGAIYFILCLLVWRALHHQTRFPNLQKRALLAAYFFTLAYGALDEFHQIFVPGRTPDPMDLLADGTGALLSVLVLVWWLWKEKRVKGPETFDKS